MFADFYLNFDDLNDSCYIDKCNLENGSFINLESIRKTATFHIIPHLPTGAID